MGKNNKRLHAEPCSTPPHNVDEEENDLEWIEEGLMGNEDSSDSDREIESDNESDDELVFEEESATEEDEDEEEAEGEENNDESEDEGQDDEGNQEVEEDEELDDSVGHEQNENVEESDETSQADDIESIDGHSTNIDNATSERDEYDSYDTSDEEDIRNTVGNIPKHWYDDYKHLGYDWEGKKILKPPTGDQMDEFLKKMDDPDFWRTVKDPQTGQDVVLSNEDIELIKRIKERKVPDVQFDDYAPWIEWFTSEVMKTPVRNFRQHKRSFLPSSSDAKKVSKLVHALKMGWIKTRSEQEMLREKKDPQFYMLWSTDDKAEEMRRIHKHIQAPKRHLPGHAESYNPPAEYLFDEKEIKQWNKQKDAPWKRKLHFIPEKYDSLRKVPAYPRFIKERFLRCLDLYLCPRGIKMKLNIEPESLVPKLPSPRDLQPFPTTLAIEYKGHTDMVRSLSTDRIGQYLLSGSDDGTVKIWEINTGRCLKTIQTDDVVRCVEWCPNSSLSLILIASGKRVLLINPNVGDYVINSKTDTILKDTPKNDIVIPERVKTTVEWLEPNTKIYENGIRMILLHFKEVTQIQWHGRGDYFASVMPDGLNRSVLISQISKRRSQLPFNKAKGLIQCITFHPTKPYLFIATQRHIRIYDLIKQNLTKKLLTNSNCVSTMAIHPLGDNLLVGTYDRKMLWFDLDLSTKPYQTLRLHGYSVRSVAFHKRYPLFASGSDDKSVIICHGMVYNDLLKNALIVPLKRLQDHVTTNDFGVLAVHFHPYQPWVFSSGADATIKLYTN